MIKQQPLTLHMFVQRWMVLAILATGIAARGESTNSFEIYLTAEPVVKDVVAYGKGDWSKVRLAETPLISADDLVSYDFSTHSMKLKSQALAKIPKPTVDGTPFVVLADGQRIYLGVFATVESSKSFAVPTIAVDRRVIATNQPADILIIERAYPNASFGAGPDPRGDSRIQSALASLHKTAAVVSAEEESRFLAAVRKAFANKDAEGLVALVCWDRVPDKFKESRRKQYTRDFGFATDEIALTEPDPNYPDHEWKDKDGISYRANLAVIKQLKIKTTMGSAIYPVGEKEGRLYLLAPAPVTDTVR